MESPCGLGVRLPAADDAEQSFTCSLDTHMSPEISVKSFACFSPGLFSLLVGGL